VHGTLPNPTDLDVDLIDNENKSVGSGANRPSQKVHCHLNTIWAHESHPPIPLPKLTHQKLQTRKKREQLPRPHYLHSFPQLSQSLTTLQGPNHSIFRTPRSCSSLAANPTLFKHLVNSKTRSARSTALTEPSSDNLSAINGS
jgi:hypothetical protein